jgi:hypothetical protein
MPTTKGSLGIHKRSRKIKKPPKIPRPVQAVKKTLLRSIRNLPKEEFCGWQAKKQHHVCGATLRSRIREFWTGESVVRAGVEYGGFQVPEDMYQDNESIFIKLVATTAKVEEGVLKLKRKK